MLRALQDSKMIQMWPMHSRSPQPSREHEVSAHIHTGKKAHALSVIHTWEAWLQYQTEVGDGHQVGTIWRTEEKKDHIPSRDKDLCKGPAVESVESSVCILKFCRSPIVTEGQRLG